MLHYKEYTTLSQGGTTRKNGKYYSNTIFTFDIETTSYVLDLEGNCYQPFVDIPEDWLKQGLCYHWQFGINDIVYYGRTLQEFKEFLNTIRKDIEGIPIIYIHNLAFETQWLINIFPKMELFARKQRHPMKAYVPELDVEFRCTYILFNMTLENVAKNYKLPHQKSKDLDYTIMRTPLTPLTEEEQRYCELDCLILYDAIKLKCKEYKCPAKIPLTHTGEVREPTKKLFAGQQGLHYYRKLWKMIPQTYEDYYILRQVFQGGWTHANANKVNITFDKNHPCGTVKGYDISSSYPTQMVLKSYPMGRFYHSSVRHFSEIDKNFCHIFRIVFYDINSKLENHYLSTTHCLSIKKGVYDNGRLASAEMYECWCNEVDLSIIRDCYDFKGYEIKSAYISKKGYLDIRFVNFILDLYGNKTSLKGVNEELYLSSKQLLNSCYGMTVTDVIRDDVTFENGVWDTIPLTPEMITQKLQKQKGFGKAFLNYAWGCWITSYARRQLWDGIVALDSQVVYCDTDSIKFYGDTDFFDRYNESIIKQHKIISEKRGIPIEKFAPLDPKGKPHPIGVFDYEGEYDGGFKTLGAKRYCYEQDGELHITIAGVNKAKGVGILSCVDDFKEGIVFDKDHSGKQISFYNDCQLECTIFDKDNVPYRCTDRYGICLAPTTYTLSMSSTYKDYLYSLEVKESSGLSVFDSIDFGNDIY